MIRPRLKALRLSTGMEISNMPVELKDFEYYWVMFNEDDSLEVVQALQDGHGVWAFLRICDEFYYTFDKLKVIEAIIRPTVNIIPLRFTKS